MDVGANRVSGAVNEIISVPGLSDVAASRTIHVPSRDAASCRDGIEHRLDSCVAGVAHDLKYLTHTVRRNSANEPHPCDVVIHRVRSILFPPNIKQNQVTLADRHGVAGVWLVMRISRV